MRKIIFTLLFALSIVVVQAQDDESPIMLESTVKSLGGDRYELTITAKIEPDWCMYSQNLPEGGPYPTTISFEENDNYELLGVAKEKSLYRKVVEDEMYEIELTKYYKNVRFKQIVKVKNSRVKKIEAGVDYMTCNTQTCLPPMHETVEFVLN